MLVATSQSARAKFLKFWSGSSESSAWPFALEMPANVTVMMVWMKAE
jgi:hypothetical protein